MEMFVVRDTFSEKSTQGSLKASPEFPRGLYTTLELPKKDGKPGSCIPTGRYQVTLWNSPKFGRVMPYINVGQGRSDIEMHWGNYPENTNGCILVGLTRTQDTIGSTREAFNETFPLIEAAVNNEGCWITVSEVQGE